MVIMSSDLSVESTFTTLPGALRRSFAVERDNSWGV